MPTNEALRQAAVQQAQRVAERETPPEFLPPSPRGPAQQYVDAYRGLGFPIGWSEADLPPTSFSRTAPSSWASKLLGLLLTTIALSLGAPFWFEVLKTVFCVGGRSSREA